RLCSLLERAREAGLPPPSAAAAARAGLAEDDARLLLRQLARYPLVVEQAARGRAPHLLAHELQELANAVHQFYTRNRVVGAGSPELEATRLALVAAARQVLANGLAVLGVTAPARMERKESS
ncbi:MAG: DALR anticodon-binding domain-containing protein, partial [bacterium]